MKVVILGSGNVGYHLALALKKAEHQILQVYNRTFSAAERLAALIGAGATDRIEDVRQDADVYLITVRDEAIGSVAASLKIQDGLVLHTSGSTDIAILSPHFSRYGVLYPLQTISKEVELDFSRIPLILEASDPESLADLKNLAFKVSPLIYEYDSEQRRCLHLGAVISCNFSNYLYSIAHQFLNRKGVDFDLLRPLILETAAKVQEHDPQDVQTGPAVRNDMEIVKAHLQLLEGHSDWQQIYRDMTDGILKNS